MTQQRTLQHAYAKCALPHAITSSTHYSSMDIAAVSQCVSTARMIAGPCCCASIINSCQTYNLIQRSATTNIAYRPLPPTKHHAL